MVKQIKSYRVPAFIMFMLTAFFGCKKDEVPDIKSPEVFPLSIRSGQLTTSKGEPFLITGDSPWYLLQGTDRKGAETYLENRRKKGVNSIVLCLIASPLYGKANAYGEKPFITDNDFSTPNDAYFDHAEYVIRKAQDKGIAVFLYPAWLGFDDGKGHTEGFYTQMIQNGPQKLHTYGEYIGQRFKNMSNVIWVMGGDSPPKDALEGVRAIVEGIQTTAGDQIFSTQNARYSSGITHYHQESWVDLNTTYSDNDSIAIHLKDDYEKELPFYFTEGTYENTGISDNELRAQIYLPVLMGSSGYFYGIKPLYAFDQGWENLLETQGSHDLQRSSEFFRSRPWFNLIPDISSEFLKNSSVENQLFAALTANGNTGIVYVPVKQEIELDLTKMSGTIVKAWWYNPATGKTTDGGTIDHNASVKLMPPGEGDWLLVLDDADTNPAPPGTKITYN
ncbi:MAG TPA: DUF4038 domain-containing protein [Bacteroidales bacterium]|nr:DUF4038 domain-containing protein [Bacteroidales bacterium]